MDHFEINASGNHFKFTVDRIFDTSPLGGKDLQVKISVNSHGLSANISVYTTTQELIKFYKDLTTCHIALQGEARYINYERDMELNLEYDHQGHVRVFGTLHVWPDRNSLSFDFETDQSYVNNALEQLKTITAQYN